MLGDIKETVDGLLQPATKLQVTGTATGIGWKLFGRPEGPFFVSWTQVHTEN